MRSPILVGYMFIALIYCNCVNPDKAIQKELGIKEISRAITAIEDRRDAEVRIINEQKEMIQVLKGNLDKVNSKGMEEHIEKNIFMKTLAIDKAYINLANQDSILSKLYLKRDSILRLRR